jgi:filamentous hemagglutinin family protein
MRFTAIAPCCVALTALITSPSLAQLNPDDSLGAESSIVTPNVLIQGAPADLIEGGAVRGSNLFHSFIDFNIGTLQRLYFANPVGVSNILTRVTGNTPSNIDGTLGVAGAANLYLLNPNGVVFGPNASLDIRGAFAVSTADSWGLGNGDLFSAANPSAAPLLTVTLTPGLQYSLEQQGDIINEGNLAVDPGQSLLFLGDTVINSGNLTAPGGQVQLLGNRIGLLDLAHIDVSAIGGGGEVYLGGALQGGDALPTAQRTYVGPTATIDASALSWGNGGTVIVWADEATQFRGTALAQGGTASGNGGFVEVSSQNWLDFQGQVNTSAPNGTTGTLLLDPTNILVVPDATAETVDLADVLLGVPDIGADGDTRIGASAITGAAANSNVVLQATNDITFATDLTIPATNVTLTAEAGNAIEVNNPIQFSTGGNVVFNAGGDIRLTNANASIQTNGGDVTLNAGDALALANAAQVTTVPAAGNSGDIQVNARAVEVSGGAQLNVGTRSGGNGGNLTVVASDSVETRGISAGFVGVNASGFNGQAESFSSGAAGNITITTPTLRLLQGGAVGTPTSGSGPGGVINVQADLIEVDGFATNFFLGEFRSGIYASSDSFSPLGRAGSVILEADQIRVSNGGQIGASTLGFADGGLVEVVNADVITVEGVSGDGTQSGFYARTDFLGAAGTVAIETNTLNVTDQGIVTARTDSFGAAGTVRIRADDITVSDAAEITADNSGGFGGAGFVDIAASNIRLDVDGVISVSKFGGSGGRLEIDADNLSITRNASIFLANAIGGPSTSDIRISDTVILADSGRIASFSFGSGVAADINLSANRLLISNGGNIVTTAVGTTGGSGNIDLRVTNTVELTNFGFILASSLANAQAGDISIQTRDLIVRGASLIGSETLNFAGVIPTPSAESGSIGIIANRVYIDQSGISTLGTLVNGGNISVQARDFVLLRNQGNIVATGGLNFAGGNGGGINVSAPFVVGVQSENSDIAATAFSGNGGRVTVTARDIIGLEFRDTLTPLSDITANSAIGVDGVTEFNRLTDVNVEEGLSPLPVDLADPSSLISRQCELQASANASEFTVTGRGGIPTAPGEAIAADAFLEDLGPDPTAAATDNSNLPQTDTVATHPTPPSDTIREAQGWVQAEDGRIYLVSAAPEGTGNDPAQTAVCSPELEG